MHYRYQRPHQLLRDYVRTVLVAEGSAKDEANKLPLFTNGMPALLCRSRKNPSAGRRITMLSLFGKSAPSDGWALKKGETIIAYFFKPFALASIFNLEAVGLAAVPIDLSTWNAQKTIALNIQLLHCETTTQKREALENLLLQELQQQLRTCEIIRYSTDRIMIDPGTQVLSEILKELGLNERTFQRMFKKFVGVTPGQYRRICQFKLSFDQVRDRRFHNLSDVAYKTGFADQSHFIRSFKEFTQTTPREYTKSGLKRKLR
jgi:AraC-like DNA-binding protein